MVGAKGSGGPKSKDGKLDTGLRPGPLEGFLADMINQTPLQFQPPIMHAPGGRALLMLPLTGEINKDDLGGTFNFGKGFSPGGKG